MHKESRTESPTATRKFDPSGLSYRESEKRFLGSFPDYKKTTKLDKVRRREFSRLDSQGHIYLDYTGGNLYPASLIKQHKDMLLNEVLGNPHSDNPTSLAMTRKVEAARRHVLSFFNASPEEYAVIFTQNASAALKLVGESYPFEEGDQYLLTVDNHNSVLGIREFDRARGAVTRYVPLEMPAMQISGATLSRELAQIDPARHNLFAFPAQSNFSGIKHPLEWVGLAQARGWDVLLDAAAFVPTNRLDLGAVKPEFVTLSFYKMFGYPTGVGALLAKRSVLKKLKRPWFGGGTIVAVSVQADMHFPAPGAAGFEDGTMNYLSIPAVDMGLSFLERIGLDCIQTRVMALSGWLIKTMLDLKHANGAPLVHIYGSTDPATRGGNIALNLFSHNRKPYNYRTVEHLAAQEMISLRTGCFCNPGTGETAFGLTENEITSCFAGASKFSTTADFRSCFEDDEVVGAIRISLGLATNFRDVFRFLNFLEKFLR